MVGRRQQTGGPARRGPRTGPGAAGALALALLLSAGAWPGGPAALGVGAARAGDVIDLYGEENVGTAGAQFLRVPVGARAVGLGQAYTACATDGPAIFWNPAGIMRTAGLRSLFVSHTEYAADIDLDFLSYHWHGQNFGYGITAGMLRSGEIPRTDELHQEGTGATFRADQYVAGLTLTRAMTDRFSMGATLKYYQENLDEFVVRSFMADLGILYYVGVGDMRIGFAVRNFGPNLQPGGSPPAIGNGVLPSSEFQSFAAPTVGSFGAAGTVPLTRGIDLLLTGDFSHPSDYAESFRYGTELSLAHILYLRGGFETGRQEGGLGAGFGVELSRGDWQVRLDYGYADMGNFGTIHHFSLDLVPRLWRGAGR